MDENQLIKEVLFDSENVDGYFKIHYHEGFAVLTVFPPKSKGKPVYYDEVMNRMKLLNIPWVNNQKINKIIKESKGIPVKLVEWPDGKKLTAHVEVKISSDNMKASVIVIPPKKGGEDISEKDIIRALKRQNIKYGVSKKVITNIVADKKYN